MTAVAIFRQLCSPSCADTYEAIRSYVSVIVIVSVSVSVSVSLPGSMSVSVSVSMCAQEAIRSAGRVLGNRAVLLKYINTNSLAIATESVGGQVLSLCTRASMDAPTPLQAGAAGVLRNRRGGVNVGMWGLVLRLTGGDATLLVRQRVTTLALALSLRLWRERVWLMGVSV